MDARRVNETGRAQRAEKINLINLEETIPMNENYAELVTTFPLFEGFTVNERLTFDL